MNNTFEFADRFGLSDSTFLEGNNFFKESPFGEHWDKNLNSWAKEIFGTSRIIFGKNVVVADLSYKVRNSAISDLNTILGRSKEPKYSFKIYAHPDGEEVLRMYNDKGNKPEKDYEVLVFIETDDGKFDFGKIVRVKFGPKVIEDLKYKAFGEWYWDDRDPKDIVDYLIDSVNQITDDKKVKEEIENDDFKDLMIRAIEFEYDNKKFDSLSWLAIILRAEGYIGNKLYGWTVDLSQWLRERKYEDEKYWNGDLPDSKYTPAFLPDFLVKENDQSLKDALNKPFDDARLMVNNKVQGNNPVYILTKTWLHGLIDSLQGTVNFFVESLSLPDGNIKNYIKHLNAFWVGVWNGIMELLAGVVELVGLIILILKNEIGFRITDQLYEKFENFLNKLAAETEQFFKGLLNDVMRLFVDFTDWYNNYEGKSYYFVKNIAELIPEIITFLIPALKGSKLAKAGKLGKEIAEETQEQIVKNTKEAIESGKADDLIDQAKKQADEQLDKSGKEIDELLEISERELTRSDELFELISKGKYKIKPLRKNVDIIDESGNILFRLAKEDVDKFLGFVKKTSNQRLRIIQEVNKKLGRSSKKYNKLRTENKGYNIPSSENGFSPDFSKATKFLYNNSKDGVVKINIKGSRRLDFDEAFRKMGITDRAKMDKIEELYTWHHMDDLTEDLTCTMQLVLKEAHTSTYTHLGSAAQAKNALSLTKYLT